MGRPFHGDVYSSRKNSSFGPKFRRNQGGSKSPMMAIGIIGQEFSRLCFEDDMFEQVKGHTFFADTDALNHQ